MCRLAAAITAETLKQVTPIGAGNELEHFLSAVVGGGGGGGLLSAYYRRPVS